MSNRPLDENKVSQEHQLFEFTQRLAKFRAGRLIGSVDHCVDIVDLDLGEFLGSVDTRARASCSPI